MKYYIIHNLENYRYKNIVNLLQDSKIDMDDVNFINHPNKNELTYKIKKSAVQQNSKLKDGWISCSYKHYLALEDIVKNKYELAVVMEDNIGAFHENVIVRLNKYQKELPKNWDIIFDSVWFDYSWLNEEKVTPEKLVYKKSNHPTYNDEGKIIAHGGTRAAQFYFLKYETAKKMYDNFLPFNASADMWINEILRQCNLNSFWSEPSLVVSKLNKVSSTNVSNKEFIYKIKSKLLNYYLGI
jgi:GR25 family glycosyltransferase involved in LPS biosynthesis